MRASPSNATEQGFSLVELMVAMVVALVLLAGILQILLSNRESFQAQQTTAQLDENARLVTFVIENSVAHAGYYTNFEAVQATIFPAASAGNLSAALGAGAVVGSSYGGQNKNDAVRLRFQGSGGVHDCAGTEIGGPSITDRALGDFSLSVDAADSELECTAAGSASAPLVDNVELFKIQYGVDSDNDGSADQYTNTVSSANAQRVRSLRIQLLLASEDNVLPSNIPKTFDFADGSQVTRNDRHARLMVDQLVALRNELP